MPDDDALQRSLAVFESALLAAIADPGVEPIHHVRTSARRLIAAILLSTRPKQTRTVTALKHLLDASAALRDRDIVPGYWERSGEDRAEFASRWQQEAPGLVPAKGWRVSPKAELTEESVREGLSRMDHRFRQRCKKAAQKGASVERIHRARIAARSLRYGLEAAGKDGELHKLASNVQRILGELHDLSIAAGDPNVEPSDLASAESTMKQLHRQFREIWKEKAAQK